MKRESPRVKPVATGRREPRRRVAIGPPRPKYLASEENDRMMMIITALAAEVSALRERLDTHEALAAKRLFATTPRVESYELDTVRHAAREGARQAMLARVYRVLIEDLDGVRNEQEAVDAVLREETAD